MLFDVQVIGFLLVDLFLEVVLLLDVLLLQVEELFVQVQEFFLEDLVLVVELFLVDFVGHAFLVELVCLQLILL